MTKKNNIFAEILNKYKYKLNSGDIVAGTITNTEKLGFLVNIGTEQAGYLPKEETTINFKENNTSNLEILNTTRDFFLMAQNPMNKQYILSIKRLDYIRAWKRIKQIYLEDVILQLNINYINKGGIITYLEEIQGFIPKSHICSIQNNLNNKIHKQSKNVIKCNILSINENKNQLIFSNKSAQLKISSHKFKIGELIYGKIIALKPYGLFLNIYGIKALLHISEMGYLKEHINKLKINNFIKIKIIHLNTKHGKISVSIRKLKKLTNHHLQY
uniref:Ribosomal protein S1 n=1 Tax=Herposiphonia versicolor TaxID=2007163 RepID=A0A1Z1MGH2_9FLOR|nr:ribosomal protein S1 [Herposiphonia versicolor]ARW64861.1 ribosomal protein S1 [Herposiphonia versicolor]